MRGEIEEVLIHRYGKPDFLEAVPFAQCRWVGVDRAGASTLYKFMDWDTVSDDRLLTLRSLYGDAVGGSLVGDSLKIAMIRGPKVYGLYSIEALWSQEDVQRARDMDDGVVFFMDASNVWFYGIKDRDLYVFDAESGELDRLGPARQELSALIAEWEDASRGLIS